MENIDSPPLFSDKVSDNIFGNVKNHEEYQYLNLLSDILENGTMEEGRNGKIQSIFGNMMRFSLKDGKIPILTTKKTAWKTCLKELLWFIRGETDKKILKAQGVHIWDANSSREFLDSRGLKLYPEDMIGPSYGYQWRNFNANYNCFTGKKLTDDLAKILNSVGAIEINANIELITSLAQQINVVYLIPKVEQDKVNELSTAISLASKELINVLATK